MNQSQNSLLRGFVLDNNQKGRTLNGAITNTSSLDDVLDLFSFIGSTRNLNENQILEIWKKAYNQDKLQSLKVLFYSRDIREGLGERRVFRIIINWLKKNDVKTLIRNIHLIPFFGRWDDLFIVLEHNNNKKLHSAIIKLINLGLKTEQTSQLVAKWLPRESKNPKLARVIANSMKISYKDYRKLISTNCNTIEQIMSSNKWENIKFEHIPSKSMVKYRKAFFKHVENKFKQYIELVSAGKKKINTSTNFPHDIIVKALQLHVTCKSEELKLLDEMWKNLPNVFKGLDIQSILPICDTSGSMFGSRIPNTSYSAVHVAFGLTMYLAEKNFGPFKNNFMTFSSEPSFVSIKGNNLLEKIHNISTTTWGMSTNIQSSFRLLLDTAIKYNVPKEEMPKALLIISDMEFNSCCKSTNLQAIKNKYAESGYDLPILVFWRVNILNTKNQPVTQYDDNTVLISGFSQNILKYVLSNNSDSINPLKIMLSVIDNERYSVVTI